MISSTRPPLRLSRLHSALTCWALSGICAATALVLAASAGAVVTKVGAVTVGLQPRATSIVTPSGEFSNNNGNVVVDGASIYLVYWDPGAWFHHEWVTNVDGFAEALGASSGEFGTVFAALGQYRDRANTPAGSHFVFKGAYSDTTPYPAEKCTDPAPLELQLEAGQEACLTDAQMRAQLQSFIATHETEKGMHAIYYVLTPPGVAVCLDEASTHCSDYTLTKTEVEKGERKSTSYQNSFCSYHGDIDPTDAAEGDGSTILYAAIPWSAGYEGSPWDFDPAESMRGQAYDCQDGGWNPEEHLEKREAPKELSEKEKEAREKQLEEDTPKKRTEEEKARSLEGPHIEEPNQEEEGDEEGDHAQRVSEVLLNQIAVEQANIVTDPLLTSWQDPTTGFEATDECRNFFASTADPSSIGGGVQANPETEAGTLYNESVAGHNYYINNVINSGDLHGPGSCVGGVGLVPRFTSPNPVNIGELVDFDGMESTVSEFKGAVFGPSGPPSTTYATFRWNFGDGSPEVSGYAPGAPVCEAPWLSPCAASSFHAYTYGGTYKVTLTITDAAGNTSKVEHEVTVNGPPSPAKESSSSGSGGNGGVSVTPASSTPTSTSSSSSTTSTSTADNALSTPAPIASERIVSVSLPSVIKHGLVADYSVNEQVAGHFEVILNAEAAKQLKISGAPASGLAKGTPKSIVIAESILVTTKGGRSTARIKFSKKVLAGLRKAGKISLMLRLIVRNASPQNPKTASVLTVGTLRR